VASDTYYDILGVSPTATPDEVKARYRNLIQRIHPDVDGPVALFRQVQEAYEVLSNPVRRAAYDRTLGSRSGAAGPPSDDRRTHRYGEATGNPNWTGSRKGWGPGPSDTNPSVPYARRRISNRPPPFISFTRHHPSGTLAIVGATLLVFSAALTQIGIALIPLGATALIIAAVAGLGGRGAKERQAYHRSGMTAIDAMTERQFEVLLEHFFANKGYRVARIRGRGDLGADLLLSDAQGRMIVQARRWTGLVRHDAVQHAVAAMTHYGAARALVVTSSDYSEQAVTVANSNGVTLWNRVTLATELTLFRGRPYQSGVKHLSTDLRAGSRICLGFLAALFVSLVAMRTKARGSATGNLRQG
jgi:restriction system protein